MNNLNDMEQTENNNQQNIKLATIQKDIDWIKIELKEIKENHLGSIYSKLTCLERKVNSRPTWLITAIVSGLVSICVALIVFILTK